jgi:hypothetical protein
MMRWLYTAIVVLSLALGAAAAPFNEGRRFTAASPQIAPSGAGTIEKYVQLAQAGGTGGTLGKTDQSLSGDRPKEAHPDKAPGPKQEKQADPNNCRKFVGRWTITNVTSFDMVVQPDGTGGFHTGVTFRWACAGNILTYTDSMGYTTRLTLSSNGTRMSGPDVLGLTMVAVRK